MQKEMITQHLIRVVMVCFCATFAAAKTPQLSPTELGINIGDSWGRDSIFELVPQNGGATLKGQPFADYGSLVIFKNARVGVYMFTISDKSVPKNCVAARQVVIKKSDFGGVIAVDLEETFSVDLVIDLSGHGDGNIQNFAKSRLILRRVEFNKLNQFWRLEVEPSLEKEQLTARLYSLTPGIFRVQLFSPKANKILWQRNMTIRGDKGRVFAKY